MVFRFMPRKKNYIILLRLEAGFFFLFTIPLCPADRVNQSIIISGEGGAGKTETAKIAMQYLATPGGGGNGIEREVSKQVVYLKHLGMQKRPEMTTLVDFYCEECSKFLADSLVEGQCPHCSQPCKGDQCEDCGRFIYARELLNHVCKSLYLEVRCEADGVND